MKDLIGEWSESINAFWYGANDTEWVAWQGSHQIFVYPCGEYPNPPSCIIQYTKRIETIEDFTDAMNNGKLNYATYVQGEAYWQDKVSE